MSKYTDGPWEARHSGTGDACVVSAEIPTKAGPFRATIVKRTSWANARLIASAPDMLATLELCYGQMSQCEKMFRDDVEFMAALEEVRAVLRYNGRMS